MLVNRQLLQDALDAGTPIKELMNRGTGRTTAAILAAISESIRRPSEPIPVRDESTPNTQDDMETLELRAKEIVVLLGLRNVSVHCSTYPGFKTFQTRCEVQITNNFAEKL